MKFEVGDALERCQDADTKLMHDAADPCRASSWGFKLDFNMAGLLLARKARTRYYHSTVRVSKVHM
jgi:hypothetical protein